MIYIKRIVRADTTRQIDLNKDSANFFGFIGSSIVLTFVNEDGTSVSGTIKKTGHTTTITGKIFSEISGKCAFGDIVVFASTKVDTKFKYFIINKSDKQYAQFDAALKLFGSHSSVISETTHLVAELEDDSPLQQIFYGAPGTGKSYKTKEVTVQYKDTIRTTFHPDSDYSTFVGAYKPTTEKEYMYGLNGDKTVSFKDPSTGEPLRTSKIEYKFVKQAFIKAYIKAWQKMCEETIVPQFLVIEEINRGNCAQIFGDIFQLLDRKEGYSEYPIEADDDIRKALIEDDPDGLSFGDKGLKLSGDIKDQINKVCGDDTVADKVCNGEVLVLPPNLYIWATMNTSDQSLFPIDSAFKRRWEWEYMPIKYKNIDWVIDINGNQYSWVSFQRKVNAKILDATNSEDKMLGDYFVNPHDGIITEKMLLNKILFYLWNDVCKDGEGDIFKISETETVTFSELHGEGGSEKLILMMNELKVDDIKTSKPSEDVDLDTSTEETEE